MSTTGAVALAVLVAAVLVWAAAKPIRKSVHGWISTDRQGRTTLVVWPSTKKRKRRRR